MVHLFYSSVALSSSSDPNRGGWSTSSSIAWLTLLEIGRYLATVLPQSNLPSFEDWSITYLVVKTAKRNSFQWHLSLKSLFAVQKSQLNSLWLWLCVQWEYVKSMCKLCLQDVNGPNGSDFNSKTSHLAGVVTLKKMYTLFYRCIFHIASIVVFHFLTIVSGAFVTWNVTSVMYNVML